MEHRKLGKSAVKTTRPVEFATETKDCFVHALAAVLGLPYADAHAFTAGRFGRKSRKGTQNVDGICAEIATRQEIVFGFRLFEKQAVTGKRHQLRRTIYGRQLVEKPTYDTLQWFRLKHKTGKFLCWSNTHAFAVVNGVIFDNGAAGPRTQVTGVFECIESSKVEGKSPFGGTK